MIYQPSENNNVERLSFVEDHVFFDSFMVDGSEKDILGLEQLPRIVDAAGLCICLEGESEIVIEAQNYRMRKGDMCVIFPNDILYVNKKSSDFKGYTIACTPEFLESANIPSRTPLYLYIKDHPFISLNRQEQKDLLKMCDFLKKHDSREGHPCREEISRHLASAIIYEVIGIYEKGEPIRQQPYSLKNNLYFELMQLIAQNYRKHRNVEFYAGELCITPRYLSAICKDVTGMTATDCINRHVIVNARILLITTEMTILQISEEMNFPNPSFFTQFFKKHMNMTPKEYRNLNKA
jgi:AraC-like DNA-binding protein